MFLIYFNYQPCRASKAPDWGLYLGTHLCGWVISWQVKWHMCTMWNLFIESFWVTWWQRIASSSLAPGSGTASALFWKLNSSSVWLIKLINWTNYPSAGPLLTYVSWQLPSQWWTRSYTELCHECQNIWGVVRVRRTRHCRYCSTDAAV